MTPEERAKLITPAFTQRAFYPDDVERLIALAITKAVEAEREACAQMCEQASADYRKIAERTGGSAAYYAVNVCDALAGKIRDKAKRGIDQ